MGWPRVVVVLTAACGSGGAAPPSAASATSPVPVPTRTVPREVAERCRLDVPGRVEDLPAADGESRLGAVAYGSGATAVVLLHQTGRSGLCGWVTYARWLASRGVMALAVDDCIRGGSTCTEAFLRDVRGQVATAVAAARARGATRVAVVGRLDGWGEGARRRSGSRGRRRRRPVRTGPVGRRAGRRPGRRRDDGPPPRRDLGGGPGDRRRGARGGGRPSPAQRKRFVLLPGDGHGWELTMDGTAADAPVTATGRLVLDCVRGSG